MTLNFLSTPWNYKLIYFKNFKSITVRLRYLLLIYYYIKHNHKNYALNNIDYKQLLKVIEIFYT